MTAFSPAQENELVNHILMMETRFLGPITKDMRYLASDIEEKNHIM